MENFDAKAIYCIAYISGIWEVSVCIKLHMKMNQVDLPPFHAFHHIAKKKLTEIFLGFCILEKTRIVIIIIYLQLQVALHLIINTAIYEKKNENAISIIEK